MSGRNDMQRVNGLRIEEESRRKAEEVAARNTGYEPESASHANGVSAFLERIQRAVRR